MTYDLHDEATSPIQRAACSSRVVGNANDWMSELSETEVLLAARVESSIGFEFLDLMELILQTDEDELRICSDSDKAPWVWQELISWLKQTATTSNDNLAVRTPQISSIQRGHTQAHNCLTLIQSKSVPTNQNSVVSVKVTTFVIGLLRAHNHRLFFFNDCRFQRPTWCRYARWLSERHDAVNSERVNWIRNCE